MSREGMDEEIPLETARKVYEIIDEVVNFHQVIREDLANTLIWNNVVLNKEGGRRVLETLLAKENYSAEKGEKTQQLLEYWNENYEAIRNQVFCRESSTIERWERKRK